MAEAVVSVVLEQLISGATDWLKGEISLLKGVKTELHNMISKMQIIQSVLEDAENQSVKKVYIKLWLEKLQDISYDMDDILDEWNTRILMQKAEEASNEILGLSSSSSSSSSPPRICKFRCFSFNQLNCFSSVKQVPWRRDVALRIKDINERINLVFSEMEQFKFVSKAVGNDETEHYDIDRTTTSFVDESRVYGRDADKRNLLNHVLEVNMEQEKSIQVLSIVGVGGLGKTTLAQLVYNDEKVQEKFGKYRIWVCVSNPFDQIKVAQDILEGLEVDYTRMKNLQTLHQSIEQLFSKVKFLLVLDDVWNEDFTKWERLSMCFKLGDPESRILVTTRKEEVVRIMNVKPSNILRPDHISDVDCWLLMSQRAFQRRTDKDKAKLEDIGKDIAKKCKGLPLAAKTLGGMLLSKESVEEWRDVLNSEIWKLEKVDIELFPHIFLSYKELPSMLKRCFLILTLFPKDTNLDKEFVVKFWMAHGYLNSRNEDEDMVKTGLKYFAFLESRAFLKKNELSGFSIHDIMHDFGLYLSGDELLSVIVHDNIGSDNISNSIFIRVPKSTKTRHSTISGNINRTSIGFDVGKLRTCVIGKVPPNVISDLVKRLKMVRVLYLEDCDLKQVPQSISTLIHLRLLDLSDNPLIELPKTIGNLYNLQQLWLEGHNLSSLPNSFGKLINLILLKPDGLALEMAPELVRKLINLENVGRIRVEESRKNSLGLLKDLNQLRGRLVIEFRRDYDDEADARNAEIGRKKHITELALFFNDHLVTDDVVAALQPPPNIQALRIYGQLPGWTTSLDHLAELEVHGGKYLSTLPPLGELQSLEKLLIWKLSGLEIIGREFLGMDKLVELKFFDCDELRGWEDLNSEEDANHEIVMPNLEILHFECCNKLEELPHRLHHQAPSLKKLLIFKEESEFDFEIKEIAKGVACRLHLRQGDQRLDMIVNSIKVPTSTIYHNYITLLDLYFVESISYLPPMGKLPYLESLAIRNFSSLESIHREFLGIDDLDNNEEFVAFPMLVKLVIEGCEMLQEWEDIKAEDEGKITVMPKLEELQITLCEQFKMLPRRILCKLPSSVKVLNLPDGEPSSTLKGEELKYGVLTTLPQYPALEKLGIERYKGEKLPNWIIYLNNLTKLEVHGAENVLCLPALGMLPSLEELSIERFSVLKLIGREFLGIDNTTSKAVIVFPNLVTLCIRHCSELSEWEDIKPEEDQIRVPIMPNLKYVEIIQCNQLNELPRRLLCKAANLEKLNLNNINDSLAAKIKMDGELLGRVKEVNVDGEHCSLHQPVN